MQLNTLDELLKELEKLKAQYGGSIEVIIDHVGYFEPINTIEYTSQPSSTGQHWVCLT